MVEILSLIIALISLLTSIIVAVFVYRQARQTNMLPIVTDMFREFRSGEFKQHQIYVYNELAQDCNAEETGFSKLPKTSADHVYPVSHFFDTLGFFVARGVVDKEIVIGFLGGAIESTWTALEPFIRQERQFRTLGYQQEMVPYQEHFEHLVSLARTHPQMRVIQRMKLRKLI